MIKNKKGQSFRVRLNVLANTKTELKKNIKQIKFDIGVPKLYAKKPIINSGIK